MAVATRSGERAGLSGGQIALVVSGLLLLLSFFLPWANTGAGNSSALGIAQNPAVLEPLGAVNITRPDGSTNGFLAGVYAIFAPLLYLIPLAGLAIAALAFVRQVSAVWGAIAAAILALVAAILLLLVINNTATVAAAIGGGGSSLPFYGLGLWVALIGIFGALGGSFNLLARYAAPGGALTTRRIATAGMLGAIAVTLGVTRLGFIPVPNVSGNATIMHIPAIIGGVLEGPVVGIVTGGIFGLFSLLQDTTGLFSNPMVSVVPRLFIGLTAWLTYRALARVNVDVAAVAAGVVGTLTNTILVVGALFIFGLIPWEAFGATAVALTPQVIAEVVIAAVLTPVVARSVSLTRSGRTVAEETTPREKSYF